MLTEKVYSPSQALKRQEAASKRFGVGREEAPGEDAPLIPPVQTCCVSMRFAIAGPLEFAPVDDEEWVEDDA